MDEAIIDFQKTQYDKWKLAILILAAVYFLRCAFGPNQWIFLDGVDLIVHEAGHLIFSFLGEFIMVAGGTILQILMPAIFVVYFYLTGREFSGALVMFWLGQSFLNVSVYAADAQIMALPLLGGDGTIHDWNYLLTRLNLLSSASLVGGAIRTFGIIIILSASALGVYYSRIKKIPVNFPVE